jgi:hypothetical protein
MKMHPEHIDTTINIIDTIGCIVVINAPVKVAACNKTISLLVIIGC